MKTREFKGVKKAALVAGFAFAAFSGPTSAAVIFTNNHSYLGGEILIDVAVQDNFMGDFGKYWWTYHVTNVSFDPNPGVSNGFSGFETALPAGVPDLADRAAPTGWVFDCCSGQPVEFDIRNSQGLGIMPGSSGDFSFTSLPRFITNSTGWFHSWQADIQSDVTLYSASSIDGLGPEVPDVLRPPVPEPETYAMMLAGLGLLGIVVRRRMN